MLNHETGRIASRTVMVVAFIIPQTRWTWTLLPTHKTQLVVVLLIVVDTLVWHLVPYLSPAITVLNMCTIVPFFVSQVLPPHPRLSLNPLLLKENIVCSCDVCVLVMRRLFSGEGTMGFPLYWAEPHYAMVRCMPLWPKRQKHMDIWQIKSWRMKHVHLQHDSFSPWCHLPHSPQLV